MDSICQISVHPSMNMYTYTYSYLQYFTDIKKKKKNMWLFMQLRSWSSVRHTHIKNIHI